MGDGDSECNNDVERILDGSMKPRHLPLQFLVSITNNFSEERKIGEGGFGVVYKGVLENGIIIAVKKMEVNEATVDDHIFLRELINLLREISHPNVVRFVGFYYGSFYESITRTGPQNVHLSQTRQRLLCFEYIKNRSLDKHITDELRGLEWNQRFQIIKGICKGLQYLHVEKGIIHMDLNPKNIMVDDGMVPQITDFGLARKAENSHTTGPIFITRGYCAPEYESRGETTLKCDIYSLGATIIALITGSNRIPDNKTNVLRRWKWSYKWNTSARRIPLQAEQVTKCIELAERCMQELPTRRPSISEIMCKLDEIENMSGDVVAVGLDSPSSVDDDDMLGIEPLELRFAFELNKHISREIVLSNVANKRVAFKIEMVRWQRLYCIQPNKGIVQPKSKSIVKITLQAQETTPGYMDHPDEFVVQSVKVENNDHLTTDEDISRSKKRKRKTDEDIAEHMLNNNEAGEVVDKVNVTIVYCKPNRQEVDQAGPSVAVSEKINCSRYTEVRGQGTRRDRIDFRRPQQILSDIKLSYTFGASDGSPDLRSGTIDLMTGAMGTLLPNLAKLLNEEHNLPEDMKEDVESLQEELTDLHTALCNVPHEQLHKLDLQDMRWAGKIRELSYDIDDMVDGLLLQIERSEPITNQGSFGRQIQKMLSQVKKVADRSKEVKLSTYVANRAVTSADYDPRLSVLYKDHKDLVGIDGPRNVLVKSLTSGDDKQKLLIISIHGEGGLGKTTLAKAVYDRLSVNFDVQAFVPVGRNPDTMGILKGILTQVDKRTTFASDHMHLIIDELHRQLRNKRYFIVIDDIWDEAAWDIIKDALVENHNGSRVITTSRILKVAERSGEVCKLDPLSDYHSRKLFYARLNGKGTCTFDQSADEQSTKYILGKCGGLPLAIITIASLLDGKPMEDWPEVYKSIGFGNEENRAKNTEKILLFSYLDLPFHLKTCLLYLSIFPEDHVIEKNPLIWKWVAEGFVQQKIGKTLFEVGEGYFNELINRSIIQPVEHIETCTISACRVHDMVLALIRSLAKKENFVTILESDDEQHLSSQNNNARIVAVHKERPHDLSNCRERVMRSFNATGCDLDKMALDSLLPRFEVLRVLSLEDCVISRDESDDDIFGYEDPSISRDCRLDNLAGLRHLRYLGLRGTHISELPEEMGDLRLLQVIDLTKSLATHLPRSVTLLRDLKCLQYCNGRGSPVRLPYGMGSLTSLEELRLHLCEASTHGNLHELADFAKELGKLAELRVLHIEADSFDVMYNLKHGIRSFSKDLVVSLNNLKKIEDLEIYDSYNMAHHVNIWDGFSPCRLLRHLRLYNEEPPRWINASRLPNISYLRLDVIYVKVGGLDNLESLPELRSLVLRIIPKEWNYRYVIARDAFPKLRHYQTHNLLTTYQPGAMPCLESFEISFDDWAVIEHFDFSLQHLPLLENVTLADVPSLEFEAAKAVMERAVRNHNNCPILVLKTSYY